MRRDIENAKDVKVIISESDIRFIGTRISDNKQIGSVAFMAYPPLSECEIFNRALHNFKHVAKDKHVNNIENV